MGKLISIIRLLQGKPLSLFEGPPNKPHRAEHLCSSKSATIDSGCVQELLWSMSCQMEEEEVGGLANTAASPGLCLRQQHLSSLIASGANISHSVDQPFSNCTFWRIFILCFFSSILCHCCYCVLISTPPCALIKNPPMY